jgi:ribosome-associated protein
MRHNELMANQQTFRIRGELITLGQLLKATGIIGMGSEVKSYLAQGETRVNGELDDRRGRKLRPGDVVSLRTGETIEILGDA